MSSKMSSASASASSSRKVLPIPEWNPSSLRYMSPKVTDKGSKSITILSSQTGKGLSLSTPQMTTWGIGEYINEKGESDGKYTMSLNFPSAEYKEEKTTEMLEKLKEFENQILDDAVKNSELWWGEEMSREVVKHTFFPILKYPKNQETKKIDYTKSPTLRCKIPYYDEKWNIEIFSPSKELLFPSTTNPDSTPLDYVPKLSTVMCVLQCGGIWIGGKGWGLTWKVTQCVVKPRETDEPIPGQCQIPTEYLEECMPSSTTPTPPSMTTLTPTPTPTPELKSADLNSKVFVDDEDDDATPEPASAPVPEPEPVATLEPEPEPATPEPEPAEETSAPAPVAVKKTIKKTIKK